MTENWKATMVSRTLNDRFAVKLTGTTAPSKAAIFERLFPVFIGFMIGAFVVVTILRPDLINWETFSQSFMLGIIIGMR